MGVVLLVVLLFALSLAAMAIGVFFGRPSLKGSCGGLAADIGGCPVCGATEECRR